MDNKAQMMVLETTLFAAIILITLIFLYQLSPSSISVDKYTNDLKIMGDDALHTIYNDIPPSTFQGYTSHRLTHYFIINDYSGLSRDLNTLLPQTVLFNIYISNGTKTVFWCNSFGENDAEDKLPYSNPITISHYAISIHPDYLTGFSNEFYFDISESELVNKFNGYEGCTYDILLEMWYK